MEKLIISKEERRKLVDMSKSEPWEDWDFWEDANNIPEYLKTIEGYDSEWRTIKDFPNYEVSIYGEVYSKITNKILSPGYDEYAKVVLSDGKRGHSKKIHRLVAEAFLENPDNKPEVNHIDGCKYNNRVTNLEWCDRSENIKHAFETGLEVRSEDCGSPKKKVRIVETGEIFDSVSDCARYLGDDPSHSHVSSCINGKRKTHKKYHFEEVMT